MKKIFAMTVLAAFLGFALPSYAQQDTGKHENTVKKVEHGVSKGAKKTAKGVKKGAKKAGNETAELATKGKAKVTDKKSDEWVGPDGQTIYVDDGNKYYWINEKGGRVWVSREQLKPRH
jgi:hypothetical protein